MIALLVFYMVVCLVWLVFYCIDYSTAWNVTREKKYAARMIFYTPAWPVLLAMRAYDGLLTLYRDAFGD